MGSIFNSNASLKLCKDDDGASMFDCAPIVYPIVADGLGAQFASDGVPMVDGFGDDDDGGMSDYDRAFLSSPGLPARSQTVLIVFYTLATGLAVLGNVIAIVVFAVGRHSQTELRWFLGNLAAADLTMAVFCMPFTFTNVMLGYWVFSVPMCPIVLFFQTVSVTVSVFTSVAIGVDRYWVVNYPLQSRVTKSRSPAVIAAIWLTAGVLSSVQLVVGRAMEKANGTQVCVTSARVRFNLRIVYCMMGGGIKGGFFQ